MMFAKMTKKSSRVFVVFVGGGESQRNELKAEEGTEY